MSRIGREILLLIGAVAVCWPAQAQTPADQNNYDAGKTPAQLFTSDCGICHKTPAGLSKAGGIFGLDSFLQEHYTASRQSARILAAYLLSVDAAQPPARATATPKARAKAADGKKSDDKSGEAAGKTYEPKPSEPKSPEPKSSESKSPESKPADPKPPEAKPAEPTSGEAAPKPAAPDKSN